MTDLEGTVLGLVMRSGRCTPYQIRHLLRTTADLAASSGQSTVYPLVKRLMAIGFLAAMPKEDRRGTIDLVVTEEGRDALVSWLLKVPVRLFDLPDPVYARLLFIGELSGREQQEVSEAILASASRAIRELEGRVEKHGSQTPVMQRLYEAGLLRQQEARKNWLELAIKVVGLASDYAVESRGLLRTSRQDSESPIAVGDGVDPCPERVSSNMPLTPSQTTGF